MSDIENIAGGRSSEDAIEIESDPYVQEDQGDVLLRAAEHADTAMTDGDSETEENSQEEIDIAAKPILSTVAASDSSAPTLADQLNRAGGTSPSPSACR